MLQIGCPKAKMINEKLNQATIDGVTFQVVSMQGLTMKVSHDAKDDAAAKSILKQWLTSIPELKNAYTNIQLIDETGRIL